MQAVGRDFMLSEASRLLNGFRRRRFRTMEQFARDEIRIRSGPFPGRFFPERNPYVLHWFRLCDSGMFSELLATGPSQSGKTLNCFVIPILFHLFELQETVIAAVPDSDIIADKWTIDLLPVIEETRYRDLLPSHGAGSKGGLSNKIQFKHGPTLRWMTAGGNEKRRAAFPSRVICFTETDGFDEMQEGSAEGTKLDQVEARARSFPLVRRRIYKECTVSLSHKHTWHTYEKRSTSTRLLMPCQHCGDWVIPERENLVGWQDADTVEVARRNGCFACPSCKHEWTEPDRKLSVSKCLPVHKGQRIENGVVVGPAPDTRTLGFRWTASHNQLLPAGDIAADEWISLRAADEDANQRKMCQFVFAIPYTPVDGDSSHLTPETVEQRVTGLGRGQKPVGTQWIGIGIDFNQAVLHWTATAFGANFAAVIDYGKTGVKHKEMPFKQAALEAIQRLYSRITDGWADTKYDRVHVDARWKTDDIVAAVKALNDKRWRCHQGFGKGQLTLDKYSHPENLETDKKLTWVGERCHERYEAKHRAIMMKADANHWKAIVQERFTIESADAAEGSLTLFAAAEGAHTQFARHITSEREEMAFDKKKGMVKTFKPVRSANHWLDSTYMSLTAGHRVGWMPIRIRPASAPSAPMSITYDHQSHERGEFSAPTFNYEGYDYGRD